jgi:hypothetical protein
VASSEQGTPLISVDQSMGRRSVVIGFGPGESNLATAPAFPVLVGNALEWLARPDLGGARRPGEIVFDDRVASVVASDGTKVPLQRVDRTAIGVVRKPGLYTVESGGARSTLAVNVGDPQVSDVERTTLSADNARAVGAGTSSHAWWLYLGLAAFALALLEWWTWQRRITV